MNPSDSAQEWIRQRDLVEAAMHANGGVPGVPPGSALAGKTGLQIMQSLLSGELPHPYMAQTMDVALIEIGRGEPDVGLGEGELSRSADSRTSVKNPGRPSAPTTIPRSRSTLKYAQLVSETSVQA